MQDETGLATKHQSTVVRHLASNCTLRSAARLAVVCAIGLCLFDVASARANEREFGEYLSSQCVTCHQRSGKARGIPSIIGWDRESFIAIMNAYKRKERDNKVMQTIAGSLSDADISALAAYFGSLKPNQ